MPDALDDLIADLDLAKVKVRRPSRFTFLCGGRIEVNASAPPACVRDYLVRVRPMQRRLAHPIVLAESAQQLYRETTYPDLITFEEDIAKIAAIVLVISESAGALAELGAFSSAEEIKRALRVLISEAHHLEESFVRYGPVQRIINIDRERVGVYPWRYKANGKLVKNSIDAEFVGIVDFIKSHVEQTSEVSVRESLGSSTVFFDLLWLLHLARAASPTVIYDLARRLHPDLTNEDAKNKLFALKVAGWVSTVSHGGKDYYFALSENDTFEYAFRKGVKEVDVIRRRADARKALKAIEKLHTTVLLRVDSERRKIK